MKNINLLDIKLKDRYVKESLRMTEQFLQEGAVHIILYLTAPVFLEAGRDEEIKEWVESADLTLWGDTETMEAAEITARGRYREVAEQEFMKVFLGRMAKGHRSVLVLSDTVEHAEVLKQDLLLLQDGITVVGTMGLIGMEENTENLINQINMISPAVIIARLSFAMQQEWLLKSRAYINTGIWIGLPEDYTCIWKKEMPVKKMGKRLLNALFNRKVHKYKK